jgi:tRNA-intron endonuclease
MIFIVYLRIFRFKNIFKVFEMNIPMAKKKKQAKTKTSEKNTLVKPVILEKSNTPIVEDLPIKEKIKAIFAHENIVAPSSDLTRELYDKTRYGEPYETKKFQYSLVEGLYLMERGRFSILDNKEKEIDFDAYLKMARKVEPNFWIRYCVFKDLRSRGYIVKTALKFGADFRVYDRGIKPGEDHAKWIVYPVSEGASLTWFEFSAKNRVAHSTRKRLLMGIVDAEGDVTFYEIRWLRP